MESPPTDRTWTAILGRLNKNQQRGLSALVDLSNPPGFWEFATKLFGDSDAISADGMILLGTTAVSWAMVLPDGLSREQSRALAARLQRVDEFDLRLMQAIDLCVAEPTAENVEIILNGLDLIDHIGVKPRLFFPLVKFTRHPDSKVLSKAARLAGQITASTGWVERQAAALEPRVRSNVLEALAENPQIPELQRQELLRDATRDPHHRVAATALFLLARKGDAGSLQRLESLRDGGEPRIRRSAAWALKQLDRLREAGPQAKPNIKSS